MRAATSITSCSGSKAPPFPRSSNSFHRRRGSLPRETAGGRPRARRSLSGNRRTWTVPITGACSPATDGPALAAYASRPAGNQGVPRPGDQRAGSLLAPTRIADTTPAGVATGQDPGIHGAGTPHGIRRDPPQNEVPYTEIEAE